MNEVLTFWLSAVLWYRAWALWGKTRQAGLVFLITWVAAQISVYWVVDRSLQAIQCPSNMPRDDLTILTIQQLFHGFLPEIWIVSYPMGLGNSRFWVT